MGIPIFLVLMYLVFQLTFTVGSFPMEWLEIFFSWLSGAIRGWWPEGTNAILLSLLVDGIIGGVGGVLVFLPVIFLLFMAIAILEDSGYMARAAFIMDNLMHKIGLHGKSFIPMLIGFGCSVPGIMATRTIESKKDRFTTILVLPLMSCGARLPIYALLIPAFFPPAWHGPMLWIIYLIGILVAIVSAKLLKKSILKGEAAPFIMELPPYRIPTLKGVLIHTWERGREYLKKAGTIILCISVILWFLTSYPKKREYSRDYGAMIHKAQEEYEGKINALKRELGLPENAVLDPENKREHSNEAFLLGEAERVLESFREMLHAYRAVEREFDVKISKEGYTEDDPEYSILTTARRARLDTLQSSDPLIFSMVQRYLSEILRPYDESVKRIEGERLAESISYTIAGRIGHAIEPFLKPMGFDWRIGTALIGALAAKEVFVAQLGIVFSVGEEGHESDALRHKLRKEYNPLTAFCIMIFCLISTPCIATVAVTKKESNSWKWALFQLGGLTALAYMITVTIFGLGTLFRVGV